MTNYEYNLFYELHDELFDRVFDELCYELFDEFFEDLFNELCKELSDEPCDELFDELCCERCEEIGDKLLYGLLKIALKNAALGLGPRAAFSTPLSRFFANRTDPKPANYRCIFFPYSLKSIFSFFHFHPHCKCSKLTDVVKRNFFILISQLKYVLKLKLLVFKFLVQ